MVSLGAADQPEMVLTMLTKLTLYLELASSGGEIRTDRLQEIVDVIGRATYDEFDVRVTAAYVNTVGVLDA